MLSGGTTTATWVASAVADGHGASPHFRSHVGSELAASGTVRLLAWQMEEVGSDPADAGLAQEVVDHWRQAVATHVANYPFGSSEGSRSRDDLYTPYGTTLLAFAADDGAIAAHQIGDGDLLLGYADGHMARPLPVDTGLVGEETYSLCLPDAVGRFRHVALKKCNAAAWPDFVCISTDGVAKSFLDDDAFLAAIAQIRCNALADWEDLIAVLPEWLRDVSRSGSGDDSTISIALYTDS